MLKLRVGYLLAGITTGLILVFSFLWSFPDGKLHIVYCDVGQGDAIYIRFPDGRDMLVDGGPNDSVLQCLGKHMPFWDRNLDLVVLSHPERDHAGGLVSVFQRYHVGYFVRSNIDKSTDTDKKLKSIVVEKKIPEKLVTANERITIGKAKLAVVWPSEAQIAMDRDQNILGAATESVNEDCVVFWLRYGSFDAFFPGDSDTAVSGNYIGEALADKDVELLKVPHHGSKTGMNTALLDWIHPKVAVISVGKNSFGHPAPEALKLLADRKTQVLRTDQSGDIHVVSDGKNWQVITAE